MAANEDEVRLKLTAETVAYKKALLDASVDTARQMAAIKTTVATSLSQARVNAAQSLAGIRQTAATTLGQARVNTAQQLAQIRVNAAQQLQSIRQTATQTLGQMGSQFETAGRRLSVGLTLPLVALAAASVKSAKDIDAQVNVLRAFTGSAAAAEKRLAQLNATALRTPGLTTTLGLQFDAQLRSLKTSEQAINAILPAIGRLNAVKQIEDPQRFTENLVQLITTGFQKRDLRELVRASPVAGQVLAELFKVDSPTNAEAIRKAAQRMGITTVDAFFTAFAEAASRNEGLARVTESIGTRFEKLHDRVRIALRPLGLAIVEALTPLVNVGVPVVEALGRAFSALPTPMKTTVVLIGGFAAALGPALFITGSLINTVLSLQKAYVALNGLALIPTISNLRLLGQVMQGTAGLTAGAAATTIVRIGGLVAAIAAAVAVSLALARVTDGYLESLKQAHPWIAKFGQATLLALNPIYGLLKGLGLVGPETKQVADEQAAAVPAVGDFTEAVEEEVESLKQLKRALAEVEIATKERVAAAQRAYNEERTTFRQFTADRIQALKDDSAAQLKVIDEGLAERRKAQEDLERVSSGPISLEGLKQLKTTKEEVEKLELERKKVISETTTQIADIQSEARVKERESAERHRDSLLSVQREGAEAQIDLLRDQAERDESLRLENEKKIVEIERRTTAAEIQELQRRADAAAEGTEARARLEDELAQKKAARDRQRQEQNRRVREAELAEELRLIRRRAEADQTAETAAQGQIDRLRDAAERGRRARAQVRVPGVERDPQTGRLREVQRLVEVEVKTYADAERAIKDIIDRGYQARIERLNDEIAARTKNNENVDKLVEDRKRLEQEQANAVEDANRRIREAEEDRDPQAMFERGQREISAVRAVAEAQVAMRQAMLRAVRNTYGVEKDLINQRYDLENERLTLAGNQAQEELDKRERDELTFWRKNVATDEEYQRKKLEVQQQYDELRKTAADQTAFEIEALEKERQDDLERQNPLSARSMFGDKYADTSEVFGPLAAAIGSVKDLALKAFAQMAEAFGQMVNNWVLTGKLGEGGIRRLVATILASFAQMTFVQGLMELAYAAAGLTHWGRALYGAPGPHLKAAAFLFAAAGAAAVAGRAIAGSGGKSQGATASAAVGGGGGDEQPNNQTFTFGVGSTPGSADARDQPFFGAFIDQVTDKLDEIKGQQAHHTALVVTALNNNTQALAPFTTAEPEAIVQKGASGAKEALSYAVLEHSGSDGGFTDQLARNLRVS